MKNLGGGLLVCLALCGLFLWGSHRLSFNPFLVCAQPLPTEAEIVEAIRTRPGDGGVGVGEDGREYVIRPLNCPNNLLGVATPKLRVELQIYQQGVWQEEQIIGVMVIDGVVYASLNQ